MPRILVPNPKAYQVFLHCINFSVISLHMLCILGTIFFLSLYFLLFALKKISAGI
jgi:hypothetical protein